MICIFDFIQRVPAFYDLYADATCLHASRRDHLHARLARPLAHTHHHCTRFNLDVLMPSMWGQLVQLVGFWGLTYGPLGEL